MGNASAQVRDRRDVHLLVVDTMADWEPAVAAAHINRPAPGMRSRYRVRTVGLTGKPIRSMGGMLITPDLALADLAPEDSAMLILPGADVWQDAVTDPALAKAQDFVDGGVPVAAICGATFGLARAGLLDDRRHTSNDPYWLASSGYLGGSRYVQEPAIEDSGIITASMAASLEFARLILGRLEVFPERALDAWYRLFKTGSADSYLEFMEAIGHPAPA